MVYVLWNTTQGLEATLKVVWCALAYDYSGTNSISKLINEDKHGIYHLKSQKVLFSYRS